MTTVRSFSLGRRGEAQWERLHAAYILSRRSGEIVLVASDSADVRDEIRRRLETMAPRLEVVAPSEEVTLAIHALAKASAGEEKLPVAWIEAPEPSPAPALDMRWLDALAVLNQTRDALRMHGPCHVVLAGPRALHDMVRRRAPDLASFMAIALLLDDTLEELVTQQGTLTWLHLSDLHVHNESWKQDHVLGALVRDLPELLEERELRPDLLFVTGDVAARGQRAEYDGAVLVLDEVAKRLGLDRRQHVFVVPGNHDVDRSRIGRLAKRDHASLLELGSKELRDAVGELLGDAKEFRLYGERLGEWCAFTETLLGRARSVSMERPWRSDVVDVRGLPVGVLSLCTVWASGPDDRKGSLILGERQIHDMVAEARDGGAQLVIALMHHPLHWLHDGEHSAIRGRLEREVDVVLHGHVHEAHSALHVAAASANVEIGAGAVYAGLGEDPHHGFSVGRLDLAEGRLDVHGFTWSTRSGKWHADSGAAGADDRGRVSLPFSPAGLAPEMARKGGQEVLATRLRHAAAKVYATVDFAGLGAGGPRRHVTLQQIFVPLRLAAKGLDSADPAWFDGDVEEETVFERGEPEDDVPEDDADVYRGRGESLEGGIVDAFTRTSGIVSLAGLDAMLAAGRKVVVLGGPGSGKSTLTKYLASTIAQREGGLIPLLLTVRDWIAEGKQEHLLDMAARQATNWLSVRTEREALEELCEAGRVLLIVDGVDEAVDAAVRRELRNQVHGFVARFPRVPVLVTSRMAGYHEMPLDGDDFDELTLEPFDDEAIEQFVRRWYDLVEDDPAARLRKRVDLLHALEVEPRAKELARNPLLARLIGMVHFSHAQLPGDRAKLFGLIIDLLLVTWPAEHKREFPELHGTVQQPMLEMLALRLQEQRAGAEGREGQAEVLVGVDQLDSMLEELLAEHLRERSAPERRYLARQWTKWLVDHCGLLQEQEPGRVGFLHLSLMEYMAGRALFERTVGRGYEAVAELVRERHGRPVWRETLLLMLGSENKKRDLGQAVVERLLCPPVDGVSLTWATCAFGLAMLREDVDIGMLHGRLLEATRDAVLNTWSFEWNEAVQTLAEVVRFSRAHGESTRRWLRGELDHALGDALVAVTVLASKALPEGELEQRLSQRSDAPAVVLPCLDLGTLRAGQWAKRYATREDWWSWAQATPLEGVLLRSFEGQGRGTCSMWVPALLGRSAWLAERAINASMLHSKEQTSDDRHGIPAAVSGVLNGELCASAQLVPSVGGAANFSPANISVTFNQFVKEFVQHFALHFALGFATRFSRDYTQPAIETFVHNYAMFLTHVPVGQPTKTYPSSLVHDFAPGVMEKLVIGLGPRYQLPSLSSLWEKLRAASQPNEAFSAVLRLVASLVVEVQAAYRLASPYYDPKISSSLVTLRLENRWLNLFFTPLVEYATKSRPLPDNPSLHALLLTYGLIQYQTTWEWPDCPHWRSWLSSDPPAHWLPAHVFHLVRSIQDPQNPTHRALADAALDRNDWPELAHALRETTLVPTPPEVLALFDHGEAPPSPPESPEPPE